VEKEVGDSKTRVMANPKEMVAARGRRG